MSDVLVAVRSLTRCYGGVVARNALVKVMTGTFRSSRYRRLEQCSGALLDCRIQRSLQRFQRLEGYAS